jgi:hypothetical protein
MRNISQLESLNSRGFFACFFTIFFGPAWCQKTFSRQKQFQFWLRYWSSCHTHIRSASATCIYYCSWIGVCIVTLEWVRFFRWFECFQTFRIQQQIHCTNITESKWFHPPCKCIPSISPRSRKLNFLDTWPTNLLRHLMAPQGLWLLCSSEESNESEPSSRDSLIHLLIHHHGVASAHFNRVSF